jgi:hypothetical protein
VLRARERAPTPYSSVVFCLGLTFESLKEFGVRHMPLIECFQINDIYLFFHHHVMIKCLISICLLELQSCFQTPQKMNYSWIITILACEGIVAIHLINIMAKAPIKQTAFIGPQILYLNNVLKAKNPLSFSNISSYCLLGLQLSQ